MASSTIFSEKRLVDEQNNVVIQTSVEYLDNGEGYRRYAVRCIAYRQEKLCQVGCPQEDITIHLFSVPQGCRRSKSRDAYALKQYEEIKEKLVQNRIAKGFGFIKLNPLA